MEFDFLAALEDTADLDVAERAPVGVVSAEPADGVPADVETVPRQHLLRLPSMRGKVGSGRHGDPCERSLLACHMRHVKTMRAGLAFQADVQEVLADSTFWKDGKLISVRARGAASSFGLLLTFEQLGRKGNRFKMKVPWSKFLEAASGLFKRNAHIAISLQVSAFTVATMQAMTASAYMSQQLFFLARLVCMCTSNAPLVCVVQRKWDETQLLCSVNADKGDTRVRSSWQVMVYRIRLLVVWPDGQNIMLRIVLPPATLIGTGAHHLYYAMFFHPAYKSLTGILGLLAQRSQQNVSILESDGAYSNERLVAHLTWQAKARANNPKHQEALTLHVRCQNHATQLNNVTLLGASANEILNKMYGMTVFMRNLGYWLRMRQAVRDWVEEQLLFCPDSLAGVSAQHTPPHPSCAELVAYLMFWKHRETSVDEQDANVAKQDAFAQKASFFLEMFNGGANGKPCHVCSHSGLPGEQRHCRSRMEAVNKCTKALLDLFLTCVPTIPAPNKWSKLFGPLDFCLSGIVVNDWLAEVFLRAFADLQFKEFDDQMARDVSTADPKLVETLCFNAVNGRRYKSTRAFLQDAEAKWAISLLTVALEGNRALTWHWLSCLSKSLSPGSRPPLYDLLDPKSSVLVCVQRFYSALLNSTAGDGRLTPLWARFGYDSYGAFCACESVHPDTLAAVSSRWDSKRHCCVPSGIARELKLKQLSSADLQQPNWKQVLYWTAASLQLSMADVESMHAQNRQYSESAFYSIAAKFVNHEAARATVEAASHSQARATAGEDQIVSSSRSATTVRTHCRMKRAKASSALELFRRDFLRRQAGLGRVRACTKESWLEVRHAYNALSSEQRAVYSSMAAASRSDSLQQRRQKKERLRKVSGNRPKICASGLSSTHVAQMQALPQCRTMP